MTEREATNATCSACNTPVTGAFCSHCGAATGSAPCPNCRATVDAGARFCPQCGGNLHPTADNRTPIVRPASSLSTSTVLIGFLVLAMAIGLGITIGTSRSSPPVAVAPDAQAAAPDISSMTPRQQFDRLIDRVTLAAENGDTATVTRFWPMATGAYQNLPPGDRDNDARFHMAWLQEFAGRFKEATALADSILNFAPNHLFGYYLRATIAVASGDSAGAKTARAAFRSHYTTQMARTDVEEYTQHKAMLDRFNNSIGAK
jgi:hypothetical protein